MTRYGLISDVHGNYKALEAFLKYIEEYPVDGIICLGDYVTDSPYPEKTMSLLYDMREEYPCYMLRGNREDYLLNNRDNNLGWKPSSANGALYYTLKHMTKKDLDFFANLPTEKELRTVGLPSLYICHGTPGDVRGNMQEDRKLRERILADMPFPYLLGGHSHCQEIVVRDSGTYINPGSLGLAIDGVGRKAQFAVLTGCEGTDNKAGSWEVQFLSIEYDVEGFLKDFQASGIDEIGMTLNKAVKKSLVTGVNYFLRCILAMQAEAEKVGAGSVAELPEEAWKVLEERFEL